MRVRRQRRRTAARCCVRTLRPHLAPAPWACYQEEFNTHVLASIRAKLGLVFIGFLLLVTGSVGATFLTIRAQATDALVVNLAGRYDQICFKLYAAVDQGPRSKHVQDLRLLGPTEEELLAAARWTVTHDPSEGFRAMLAQALAFLGVEDADASI